MRRATLGLLILGAVLPTTASADGISLTRGAFHLAKDFFVGGYDGSIQHNASAILWLGPTIPIVPSIDDPYALMVLTGRPFPQPSGAHGSQVNR